MAGLFFPVISVSSRLIWFVMAATFAAGTAVAPGQTMMEDIAKPVTPKLVPDTNAVAAPKPPPVAVAQTPPPKPPPPAAKPPPPFLPDLDVDRYGKILSTGNEPAYPIKLTMPFPGIGELKIPSQAEVQMRQKIELLAGMSDADIRTQLAQWPAFTKMSLTDEGAMLTRIQQFRERRTKIASEKAHNLGLLTLTPAQQAKFEKEYWNRQLQMDEQLAKQFAPAYKDAQLKLQQDLFREFSSLPAPPPAPGAKPPALPSAPVTTASNGAPVAPVH